MTWEIVVGIVTLVSALCSVISVVLRVNRTLVSLEDAGKELRTFMEGQCKENQTVRKILSNLDRRLSRLEGLRNDREERETD